MSTQSQIDANRRNSQKSTGPRTEAGKARSRMNALKYGIDAKSLIFPGEDPAQFDALRQALIDEHQPGTPNQIAMVDIIAAAIWKWRRYQRSEQQYFTSEQRRLKQYEFFKPEFPLLFPNLSGDTFLAFQRRADAEVRTLNRALAELRRLKQDEAALVDALADTDEPETPAAHTESPERSHFSPPEPPSAPTEAPDPVPPDPKITPESPERRVA